MELGEEEIIQLCLDPGCLHLRVEEALRVLQDHHFIMLDDVSEHLSRTSEQVNSLILEWMVAIGGQAASGLVKQAEAVRDRLLLRVDSIHLYKSVVEPHWRLLRYWVGNRKASTEQNDLSTVLHPSTLYQANAARGLVSEIEAACAPWSDAMHHTCTTSFRRLVRHVLGVKLALDRRGEPYSLPYSIWFLVISHFPRDVIGL